MKELTKNQLYEIKGGGFAHDAGCAIRYILSFNYIYQLFGSADAAIAYAEGTKGECF